MTTPVNYAKSLPQDLTAGLVVFLVALPLCLGVALASGAPPISGIVSGIVGGMLVVWINNRFAGGEAFDYYLRRVPPSTE